MDKGTVKYTVTASLLLVILFVSSAVFFSPVSGYQSMTADWYQVRWNYPLAFGSNNPYVKDVSGGYITWDGDETDNISVSGGWSDMNSYSAETSDPKYDHNIDYNDWWVNDTVSPSEPSGTAQHYEWAIDSYTLNVNFATLSGAYGCDAQTNLGFGAEFWLELQNNYQSVFTFLGAEKAVSYVLYAEVGTYEWIPATAANHRILPTTDKFEVKFLDGTAAVPPGTPQQGSDLNFAALEKFSHIALQFYFADFGLAAGGTDVTVHYVINLSILTIGRFDYALTYVQAGQNDAAPMGDLGILDGIGAALGAGYAALMDGVTGLADALFGPLVTIAIVAVCVVVIIVIWRRR